VFSLWYTSDVLGRYSNQAISSLYLKGRRRRKSAAFLSQSAHTERLNPPLTDEEAQLPNSDWKGGYAERKEIT
jgi:hypothetical protein